KAYEDRVIIAKLNVDENPDTAAKFGIRGIPTLMLFKDGKAAATKDGAMSKSQLTAFLDESLQYQSSRTSVTLNRVSPLRARHPPQPNTPLSLHHPCTSTN